MVIYSLKLNGVDVLSTLLLDTDFQDYYDAELLKKTMGTPFTLTRHTGKQHTRAEQLGILSSVGLTTPDFGIAKVLIPRLLKRDAVVSVLPGLDELFEVVVFTEQNKLSRLSYKAALSQNPESFSMEYIPTSPSGNGLSFEYICVGERQFWLEHSSINHWKSKNGHSHSRFFSAQNNYVRDINKPGVLKEALFSISLIRLRGKFFAIKYNNAPMLKGSLIESVLSPIEAAEAIFQWERKQANI